MQAIVGDDVRRVVGTSATLINNFVHWFEAILANMNLEAQRRALAASRGAASLVFADAGDDKTNSIAVKTAPTLGDVRKVKYSAEMPAVRFAPQNRDEKHPLEDRQLELNKLRSASVQLDLELASPKHSQSRKDDYQKGNEEKRDAQPNKRDQTDES